MTGESQRPVHRSSRKQAAGTHPNLWTNIMSILLFVGAAAVLTATLRSGEWWRTPDDAVDQRVIADADGIAQRGWLLGPDVATVRITVFSDFQCAYCAEVSRHLGAIRQRFPGDVAVVYRHFPLTPIHVHALPAALAAECAGAQGRFAPFHDALFERQDSLGLTPWTQYAAHAGVPDLDEFVECVRHEWYRDRVMEDYEAGLRIGVTSTPTFIFGKIMLIGAAAIEQLETMVTDSLEARVHR